MSDLRYLLAVMVGLLINPGQIGLIYALVVLMAVGNAAIYQVPWAMIPDCVDVTELSTGKNGRSYIWNRCLYPEGLRSFRRSTAWRSARQ